MKPAYYLKHTAPVESDKYHNMWCWGKFLSLVITGQMMLFVMKIYNHVGTYVYKYIFVFMYFICVCVLGGRGRGLHYQYFWIHFSVSGRMQSQTVSMGLNWNCLIHLLLLQLSEENNTPGKCVCIKKSVKSFTTFWILNWANLVFLLMYILRASGITQMGGRRKLFSES